MNDQQMQERIFDMQNQYMMDAEKMMATLQRLVEVTALQQQWENDIAQYDAYIYNNSIEMDPSTKDMLKDFETNVKNDPQLRLMEVSKQGLDQSASTHQRTQPNPRGPLMEKLDFMERATDLSGRRQNLADQILQAKTTHMQKSYQVATVLKSEINKANEQKRGQEQSQDNEATLKKDGPEQDKDGLVQDNEAAFKREGPVQDNAAAFRDGPKVEQAEKSIYDKFAEMDTSKPAVDRDHEFEHSPSRFG